jgi:hypothetical protein
MDVALRRMLAAKTWFGSTAAHRSAPQRRIANTSALAVAKAGIIGRCPNVV